MLVKKRNVHRENAKSVCRILLIRLEPISATIQQNPKKTLGLRSYSGMGRSKKPSHATVPLMMTTHENININ